MFAPFLALCWLLSPHSGLAPLRLDAHGFPLPPGAVARLGDLHFAQPGPITALALSPDDKLIATAGRHIYLWNPDTGRIVRELRGRPNVGTLAFSKDGQFLAAGSSEGEVQVWKVATGALHWPQRERKPEGSKRVTELRFLDNDRLLAVAHNEGQVCVWNVAGGMLVRAWDIKKDKQDQLKQLGPGYEFATVTLSPSGALMGWLACSQKYTEEKRAAVFLYETATGKLHRQVKNLQAPGEKIQLLDEGKTALIQTAWDFSLPSFGGHEIPAKISDGKGKGGNAIVELAKGTVRYRFAARLSPELGRPLRAPYVATRLMAISPDRKSFFTQDEVALIRWDLSTGKKVGEWKDGCTGLAFCSTNDRIVIARGSRWQICDSQLHVERWKSDFAMPPRVHFLPEGRLLVNRWYGGQIQVWNSQRCQIVEQLWPHPAPDVGREPRAQDLLEKLFLYYHDNQLVVRNLVTDRQVCQLQGVRVAHNASAWPALSNDGRRALVSTLERGKVLIRWFDTKNGAELGRYIISQAEVFDRRWLWSMKWYSADGSVFGYIAPDSRLTLVDCASGKIVQVLGLAAPSLPVNPQEYQSPVWNYQSSGFHRFIRASRRSEESPGEKEIALWDRSTGLLLRHFRWQLGGEFDHGWEPILSPDGRLAAVQLWSVPEITIYETASGRPRGRLPGPGPWPFISAQRLSFSPDGKTLSTSCADTTVLLWDLNRPLSGRPLLPAPRTAAEREHLWQQLADRDAALAEQALWTLVHAPEQALTLLRAKLQPVRAAEPQHLQTLLQQLDSKSFKQREAATRELLALGELAVPALRTALEKKDLPLEQSQRAAQLLHRLEEPTAISPWLRELRAIEVLERIGSTEARQVLERLAAGNVAALVTREAQVTLARMQSK